MTYHEEDCELIKRIARELGFNITLHEALDIWEKHSASLAARWLIIDDNEEVRQAVIARFGEGE